LTLSSLPNETIRQEIISVFNGVKLIPNWAMIEREQAEHNWQGFDDLVKWAFEAGLDVSIGPVIDLANGLFPEWVLKEAENTLLFANALDQFVGVIVDRYKDRVRGWQICSGFNHQDRFELNEEARMTLTARLYETARAQDQDCSWTLGLAQPWGDYLRQEDYTYPPLVFTDNLIRNGFQLTALELEVASRARKNGLGLRDSISLFKLTELFGMLSIPLDISFSDTVSLDQPWINHTVGIALALSLPQVRSVIVDYAQPNGERTGVGLPPELRMTLRELRTRYLI
jgi:hypothetical protein